MRTLVTVVMACVLTAGVTAMSLSAAVSGQRIILVEDSPQGSPPPTDAAKPDPGPGSDQSPPQSAAPDAVDFDQDGCRQAGHGLLHHDAQWRHHV